MNQQSFKFQQRDSCLAQGRVDRSKNTAGGWHCHHTGTYTEQSPMAQIQMLQKRHGEPVAPTQIVMGLFQLSPFINIIKR